MRTFSMPKVVRSQWALGAEYMPILSYNTIVSLFLTFIARIASVNYDSEGNVHGNTEFLQENSLKSKNIDEGMRDFRCSLRGFTFYIA